MRQLRFTLTPLLCFVLAFCGGEPGGRPAPGSSESETAKPTKAESASATPEVEVTNAAAPPVAVASPPDSEPKAAVGDLPRKDDVEPDAAALEDDGPDRAIIIVEATPAKVDIPELPADQLPARTRVVPDPSAQQYSIARVRVRVEESVRPQKGETYSPEVRVVGPYLAEYFRRGGYEVAADDSAEAVAYSLEGTFNAQFDDQLIFQKKVLGWKYVGTVSLVVKSPDGEIVDRIEYEDVPGVSVKSERSCVLDLRRLLAKRLYDYLFVVSSVFRQDEVVLALAALVADPLEVEEPLTTDEVISRVADLGLPAVPYLLEALTDARPVLAETGGAIWGPALGDAPEALKIYHVADKCLEEIFQKVSRLHLDSNVSERFVIIRGWENEWRRFCPPFRNSPQKHLTRPPSRGEAGKSKD